MITLAENLTLDWGDFMENAGGTLRDLHKDLDFTDVTLVCEDNHQIPCHKVILAASSTLLKAMIKSTQHSHPLLYFWGVKARDLVRIIEFIYSGRVQVFQSDLADFLTLAEVLKVKGVSGEQMREKTKKLVQTKNTANNSEVPDEDLELVESESIYPLAYETNTQDSAKLPGEGLSQTTNDPAIISSKLSCFTMTTDSYNNTPTSNSPSHISANYESAPGPGHAPSSAPAPGLAWLGQPPLRSAEPLDKNVHNILSIETALELLRNPGCYTDDLDDMRLAPGGSVWLFMDPQEEPKKDW